MSSLLGQFKFNWTAGLLLSNGSPFDCVSTRGDVLDFKGDQVATAQFAVDGYEDGGTRGRDFRSTKEVL